MFDVNKKAKLRAMHVLTRMDKTEEELRRILQKGEYEEATIEEAIAYVKSFGYIDDERYVKQYVANFKHSRSIKRMKYDLSRKGIGSDLLQLLSDELSDEEEKDTIRKLLRKKWKRQEKPNEKELRSIYGYLARQGFKSHDIWVVLYEENLT